MCAISLAIAGWSLLDASVMRLISSWTSLENKNTLIISSSIDHPPLLHTLALIKLCSSSNVIELSVTFALCRIRIFTRMLGSFCDT